MNYSEIISSLNHLTAAELSALNVEVIAQIKFRRTRDAKAVKATIKYGDTVVVNHPQAHGKMFTVNQINRTKAVVVDNDTNRRLSVPLSLVQRVIDAIVE